ncbi:MAG TPA: TPM domain-containing protein [Ottowia sp.]|uniref:TPM domain-containing protein n=1 Tax=Ottowia sp. TaxID=1898956 RepID=UPI002CC1B271|nr:TPM domain-containing protein [Ottowia sp.]HMN22652.1 TPM domain-containing protein [Ottowia sp.]
MARLCATLVALLLAGAALLAQAQGLQPVPALTAHVIDTTGTLDAAQSAALEAKLATLEREKGAQLVLLMVPTTAPEDIAAYANRVGNTWKIGRAGVGDGLLVLVAKNDRRVRIEVAKTLEGAVPDIAASHIIDEAMTPFFRQGDFAAGLDAAVDQLSARIRGEPLPPVQQPRAQGARFDPVDLMVFLFIGLPIISTIARAVFGNKLGSLLTGAGVGTLAYILTASLVLALVAAVFGLVFALLGGRRPPLGPPGAGGRGRGPYGGPVFLPGGWGSGGGSGGGFSSGGGGDFGGGGASGRW